MKPDSSKQSVLAYFTLNEHTQKPDVFAAKKKKTRRQPWKWEKSMVLQERASYWGIIMTTIFINDDNRCIKIRQHPALPDENYGS